MTYRGHIKNGTIVLDDPVDLPEGAEVDVALRPARPTRPDDATRKPGDGLRAAIGSWAEDGDEPDRFIEETYRARSAPHRELPE